MLDSKFASIFFLVIFPWASMAAFTSGCSNGGTDAEPPPDGFVADTGERADSDQLSDAGSEERADSDQVSDSDQAPDTDSVCSTIQIGSFAYDPMFEFIRAPIQPALGSGKLDVMVLQLWEVGGFKQKPGTFDLAQGDDGNLLTCNHCVRALETYDTELGSFTRQYFQSKGTMTIQDIIPPVSTAIEAKGSIDDVTLVEITIDEETGKSVPVPGGRCLQVTRASFDTLVPLGTKCQTYDECGDINKKICNPLTRICALAECGQTNPCPSASQHCYTPVSDFAGVCTQKCIPYTPPACPAGSSCVSLDFDDAEGFCLQNGSATTGEDCPGSDISTGCAPGNRCVYDEKTLRCFPTCSFWSANPSCPAKTVCFSNGLCLAPEVDVAMIGKPCQGVPGAIQPDCNLDGKAARGVCLVDEWSGQHEQGVCRKYCRTLGNDCPTDLTCIALMGYERLGACEPKG